MSLIFDSLEHSLFERNLEARNNTSQYSVKQVFEFDPSPRGGKRIIVDQYLLSPSISSLQRVEASDALVPDLCQPSASLMDLSSPVVVPQVLDTPAIIDSIVDVLPFRFGSAPATEDLTSPSSDMSPAAVRSLLGLEETERFQDLTLLMAHTPQPPTITRSPAPALISPTESVFSDVTQGSNTSLLSAASTSSDDQHFFPLDFDVLGAGSSASGVLRSSVGRPEDDQQQQVDKRKRNNLASRRSRMTRRERERDMEKQMGSLWEENVSLKRQVKNLEELVEQTKKVIIRAVARR